MKINDTEENKTLRLQDYEKFLKLRNLGHSIYCAIDMTLYEEKCKCKDKENEILPA
jgi:hypothetical protein